MAGMASARLRVFDPSRYTAVVSCNLMEILLLMLYPLALYRPRLILLALVPHAVSIVYTAMSFGRIPLIGLHDTLGFLAFSTAGVYALVVWNRRRDLFSFLTIPLILVFLTGALLSPSMGGPLPPVLRTIWFELHVLLSFLSYALFAIGAIFGFLVLYRDEQPAEINQYRCLLLGYVLFSIAMIFGGIWASLAWGSYWLWTPKELWTTIVWLYYGLYLHARLVRRWTGPTVVWLGIVGFAIVLFTYVGVGLLMKSSHEF